MPPLKFDARLIWIKDDLHAGRRQDALAKIDAAMASGTATPELQALADYLSSAKRGRQPFGAKHRWIEIGQRNDELRDEGMSHADRMAALALEFRLNDEAKIKTAISTWERATAAYRASIDDEI